VATSAPLDPWAALRAALPGYSIVRLIDLDREEQAFQIVRANRADATCSEYLLDGCTLIRPEGERTPAQIADIINRYDEAWRAQRATEPASAG
jgi:hypothetical protein